MAAVVVIAELADGEHVAGAADEGRGDHVDALLDAEQDIRAVLFADGRHLQVHIRHGDALAAAERAAVDHAADDVRAVLHAHDVHRQQAVVNQHADAGPDQLRHFRIGDGDLVLVALDLAAGEHEFLTGLQLHLARCQRLGAHLRALGVQQDAHRDALLLAQALDALDARRLLLVAAVGHVQAADVHALVHQPADHLVVVARRTQRADDLRLSDHWGVPPHYHA